YQNPRRKAGRLHGMGGVDSYSDNGMASVLLAIMPFMGSFFWEGKKREKMICIMAAPFVLNAFILCNSRGAFLGLLVTSMVALMYSKGSLRRKIFLTIIPGAILFISLMDPQFIARQKTIQNYEQDGSASERIVSWKGALHLIQDYPLGTGGGGYEALSPIYIPEVVEAHDGAERNVHSTFLQIATDWGISGLVFFMGMLITTVRELHKIRSTPPSTPDERRTYADSLAIELGIVGSMVAGIFSSRVYGEATYWLPAFAAVLSNIHASERMKTREGVSNVSSLEKSKTEVVSPLKEI
ncbi:MAG: O-antigen ligase family protein, partial [Waddliaceae bacterium]